LIESIRKDAQNRLHGDLKIDFAAMTKSTARRSKNQLRGDDKIDCAAI
jgi:hypothetical protein